MSNIIIPQGCIGEKAEYKHQKVDDYNGNPYIEALPPLLSFNEIVEKLAFYPRYKKEERQLDSHYRIHMVNRMFQTFQPLPLTIELERKIAIALRQGYIYRNPFKPEFAKAFENDYRKIKNINVKNNDMFYPSSCGFTLIGISGLGKTCSLQRILNMYPQIIVHSEYKNMPLSSYQVVWIKLECPFDGSIKGLLFEFFSVIDQLLGTDYYQKMMKTRATTDMMLTVMNQVVRNCALGLLVIDEIQHLSMAKSGGSEKMLNFFVNLVNTVGIPVILVGTPKAISILQGDFRQARRGAGPAGDMVCDRIQNDEMWELLVESIWHYQWTRQEIPLTKELINVLYDETQGIPDLLKKVYGMAQLDAIVTGKEEITPQIVRKVARENLKLVQPMLHALKRGNVRDLAKYEDIYITDVDFDGFLNRTREFLKLEQEANKLQQERNKKQQSDLMENKKEAVLKLIDLGINVQKAQKTVDNLTIGKLDIEVNEIVIEAISRLTQKKGEKKVKKVDIVKNDADIRVIVKRGRKNKKSAYTALGESGYIKSPKKDMIFSEVVQ